MAWNLAGNTRLGFLPTQVRHIPGVDHDDASVSSIFSFRILLYSSGNKLKAHVSGVAHCHGGDAFRIPVDCIRLWLKGRVGVSVCVQS